MRQKVGSDAVSWLWEGARIWHSTRARTSLNAALCPLLITITMMIMMHFVLARHLVYDCHSFGELFL